MTEEITKIINQKIDSKKGINNNLHRIYIIN